MSIMPDFESRFVKIETHLVAIRGELVLLEWMVGLSIVLLSAVALKLFLH